MKIMIIIIIITYIVRVKVCVYTNGGSVAVGKKIRSEKNIKNVIMDLSFVSEVATRTAVRGGCQKIKNKS